MNADVGFGKNPCVDAIGGWGEDTGSSASMGKFFQLTELHGKCFTGQFQVAYMSAIAVITRHAAILSICFSVLMMTIEKTQ